MPLQAIENYGVIATLQSIALVGMSGTIDEVDVFLPGTTKGSGTVSPRPR